MSALYRELAVQLQSLFFFSRLVDRSDWLSREPGGLPQWAAGRHGWLLSLLGGTHIHLLEESSVFQQKSETRLLAKHLTFSVYKAKPLTRHITFFQTSGYFRMESSKSSTNDTQKKKKKNNAPHIYLNYTFPYMPTCYQL